MSGLVHQLSRNVSAFGRSSRASQADSDIEAPMLASERETSTSQHAVPAAEIDGPETPSKDLQQVQTVPLSASSPASTSACVETGFAAEAGHFEAIWTTCVELLPQQLAEGPDLGCHCDTHSCCSYKGSPVEASLPLA